jgi:hypothetical protein
MVVGRTRAYPPFGTPPIVCRCGAAAFQNRIFGTRCDAGARYACLAILVVPGFECFSGREHLEGQWAGGVGPSLAGPGVRPAPARAGAEEQTQEGGLGGAGGVR